MGSMQRNKGHNFERRIARDLKAFFPEAKRGFQTRGGTSEAPDVDGTPWFIECKCCKKVDKWAALNQAVLGAADEAARTQRAPRQPIVVFKEDRRPVRVLYSSTTEAPGLLVECEWDDWLALYVPWYLENQCAS